MRPPEGEGDSQGPGKGLSLTVNWLFHRAGGSRGQEDGAAGSRPGEASLVLVTGPAASELAFTHALSTHMDSL